MSLGEGGGLAHGDHRGRWEERIELTAVTHRQPSRRRPRPRTRGTTSFGWGRCSRRINASPGAPTYGLIRIDSETERLRAALGARRRRDERVGFQRRGLGHGGDRERLVREPRDGEHARRHAPRRGRRAEQRVTLTGPAEEISVGGRPASLDGELELAQRLVQTQALVVRLLAPPDDQGAVEFVRPGGVLLRARSREHDGARRHLRRDARPARPLSRR